MNQQTDNRLPDGWVKASLGGLNQYQASTVQPEKFAKTTFELYSVPAFPEKIPEILQGESIGSSKQLVLSKDVLICKINPRINRVWVVKDIKKHQQIASSEWIVFRQPALNERYFGYYFQSLRFRNLLCADVTGVGGSLTRAQPKKVATFELPLPPLAEQHYLADKLDSLLARIQTLSDQLAAVPALLKQFRQSVLADAVSGKLTAEWRSSQDIDKAWEKKKLSDIVTQIEAGKNIKCIETPPNHNEYGIVKISAVTWGVFDEAESKTLHKSKDFLENRRIKEGDFLISRANTLELVGSPVIVETISKNLMLSDKVLRLCMPEQDKKWVLIFMRSANGRAEIEKRATGNQLSMRNIGQKALLDIDLPKPSIAEQTEIVRRVETLFALADNIEQQSRAAAERVALLTQSVLAKAFRGELSEQWRREHPDLISGDNSAAALLARIQAERAATGKKSRRA